ncbi:FRG domain-containing protein [Mycetocola zhujimingii]|uniref:FRG domain-containing protein n=1 Tax=Mycetocola zhujimingii TaxID=2079792 RepID=A0A2U1TC00_9MICO|nr:hypothetical protein DF223_12580 [Mycetocola zhujimingii]
MSTHAWKRTGWFVEARGSRDLFSLIGAIGGYSSQASLAWRGMASSDYELTSSLQRTLGPVDEATLRLQERKLLAAAREWGLGYGPGGWASDLQLLADLQHYGTATRLLDVSSNPMTALWFACQPAQDHTGAHISRDGVLLAVNTAGWKRYGRSRPDGSYSAIENPIAWELEHALAQGTPFIVESLMPNDRLRAQEGFFLAGEVPLVSDQISPFASFKVDSSPMEPDRLREHLRDPNPQRGSGRGRLPFVAVLIPSQFKAKVLQRLENSFNRHSRVLFPDFTGFREYSARSSTVRL